MDRGILVNGDHVIYKFDFELNRFMEPEYVDTEGIVVYSPEELEKKKYAIITDIQDEVIWTLQNPRVEIESFGLISTLRRNRYKDKPTTVVIDGNNATFVPEWSRQVLGRYSDEHGVDVFIELEFRFYSENTLKTMNKDKAKLQNAGYAVHTEKVPLNAYITYENTTMILYFNKLNFEDGVLTIANDDREYKYTKIEENDDMLEEILADYEDMYGLFDDNDDDEEES